jgi:very-short-patch-repair endonuclease
MSVCYGYDANKKMIMNFGPINRKGGEKRLNVIFSRAKKHIAVVSSIRHTDITNEYNEGANYFRKFLQYATMVSSGRNEDAAAILQSMSNKTNEKTIAKNIVVDEIAARLKAAGFTVDGDEPATDVMEKYFQRPQTMQAFGWNVIQVWTKDWFHKKEDVMKQIIAALDKKQE